MRPSYVRSNESCCILVRLVPIHLGFWFLIKPAQISSTKLLDHGLVWPNLAQSMQSLYYSENVIILDLEAQKRPSPQVPVALCAALFLSKIAVGCGICSQFDVSGFPKIDPLPASLMSQAPCITPPLTKDKAGAQCVLLPFAPTCLSYLLL